MSHQGCFKCNGWLNISNFTRQRIPDWWCMQGLESQSAGIRGQLQLHQMLEVITLAHVMIICVPLPNWWCIEEWGVVAKDWQTDVPHAVRCESRSSEMTRFCGIVPVWDHSPATQFRFAAAWQPSLRLERIGPLLFRVACGTVAAIHGTDDSQHWLTKTAEICECG